MALIEWRDTFNTGNAAVDHEHREMIDLINDVHGRLAGGAPEVDDIEAFLGEINAKISAHFALEEHMMRNARYAKYQAHKDDHEALLDEIREIMATFDAEGLEAFESALSERLTTWFTEHFRTFDTDLHRVLGH